MGEILLKEKKRKKNNVSVDSILVNERITAYVDHTLVTSLRSALRANIKPTAYIINTLSITQRSKKPSFNCAKVSIRRGLGLTKKFPNEDR